MNRISYIIAFFLVGIFVLQAAACTSNKSRHAKGNEVMVASMSSNGRYVITTNKNRHAYLWDLKKHQQKQLSTYPVNIYSAYFIKGTDQYLIQQDNTNQVLVKDTQNQLIKTIKPGFPSYGEVMSSDLKHYYASDKNYNVYAIDENGNKHQLLLYYCIHNHNGQRYQGSLPTTCAGVFSTSHLIGLQLSRDDTTLTASGDGSLFVWGLKKHKHKSIIKNGPTTFHTVSPDGHYVVTGDVGKLGITYDLKKQKLVYNQSYGIEVPKTSHIKSYFEGPYNQHTIDEITGLNFISNKNYLVSFRGYGAPFHYLGLYKVNDITWRHEEDGTYPSTYPLKYLKLDTKTVTVHKNDKTHKKTIYPETQSFLRSQSFDTAPQANRVVMGQANGGGIMVYQYDSNKQKLKLIWAPQLKEHESHWWEFWK